MAATYEVEFNVIPSIKERMERWSVEGVDDDLFTLSPLTSAESSPTTSPTLKAVELKEEVSEASAAVETALERLKRRRRVQGQKNRAKRLRTSKQGERDGPPARIKAEGKYAASSTLFFSSTSAADSNVASTGYVALNRCIASKKEYSLTELKGFGFDVLNWDGRYAQRLQCHSLTHKI